jgi:hypothetical protein
MATVSDMQFSHFSGRVGKNFEVAVGGHRLSVVLDAAQALPGSIRPGGAFRLEFLGPSDPVLAQGMFPFEIGKDRFEIFVVPIGRDALGTRYEAVFF